jgi:hypothetical protein
MAIFSSMPNTLTNGQTADATQVMANFNQLVNNGNTGCAALGANNDITSLSALSTPLSTGQGGTGQTTGVPGTLVFSTVGGNTINPASSVFMGCGAGVGATEGIVSFPMPYPARIRNMFTSSNLNAGAGGTTTYTLRVAGSTTALAASIAGATAAVASNTATSIAVAQGALVSLQVVTNSSAAAASHMIAVEVDKTP